MSINIDFICKPRSKTSKSMLEMIKKFIWEMVIKKKNCYKWR